jgi:hypothetical protein
MRLGIHRLAFVTLTGAQIVLLLAMPAAVIGQTANGSVSISASVGSNDPPPTPGPTKVIFKGIAYPSSQVTVQRDGAIVATVPADPTAHFEVEITESGSGIFTYGIFSEDAQGREGRTSNFTLSLTAGTTTTVNGIFLGPTIGLDRSTVKLGETVTMLGVTAPQSEVTIFVSSEEEHTFKVNAESNGLWTKQFLGSDLGIGSHSARVKAVATTNEISGFSNTVSFSVVADDLPVDPCAGKRPGDMNCDGRVNLVDFSILLFYWKKTNPTHPRVDINKDKVVNIQDLSILLFWWTK